MVLVRELARGGQSVIWLGESDARGAVAVKRPLPGLHPHWVCASKPDALGGMNREMC